MDKNIKLYKAAYFSLEAAKHLNNIEEGLREQLLSISQKLLDNIVVDQEEIRRIEKYEQAIKKKISVD